MIVTSHEAEIDYHELATLKHLALEGAIEAEIRTTTKELAGDLGISSQTASRRLRTLERAGLIERRQDGQGQRTSITPDGERALMQEYGEYQQVFDSGGEIELAGRVTDGVGEGAHYISLPGYTEQFRERLGYEPFAGTLNVDLDRESTVRRTRLGAVSGIPIDAWEGEDRTYGAATCYPARIEADGDAYEPVHVLVPDRTHHDIDQLEVIAEVRLRDELGLDEEEGVTIYVAQ